jgi:hypothetical protein
MFRLIFLLAIVVFPLSGLAQNRPAGGCPTVTVTGPAGVTLPGQVMTIYLHMDGEVPKNIRITWEITDSVIMGGQGTPVLKARYLERAWGSKVTATARIDGLPFGCREIASDTIPIIVDPGPEHLGSINNAEYKIGANLLKRIGDSLYEEPNSQLYVWIYYGPNAKRFTKLKEHLLRQLSATRIDPTRFTIQGSGDRTRGAVFWRIPPGSSNPVP